MTLFSPATLLVPLSSLWFSAQAAHAAPTPRPLILTQASPSSPPATLHAKLSPDGKIKSAKEYFATLWLRFQPSNAKGVRAVLQFDLSGADACRYTVFIADGAMTVEEGRVSGADIIVSANTDDYVKVANGELEGTVAFFSGKLRVSGNLALARKMQDLFPAGRMGKR